jgi:spermidine synthase
MGFTLRAALKALGPGATVTVAELAPEVIEWGRGPLAEVFGDALDDPRVHIVAGDVRACIDVARGCDAILLDVDNGPDGLVQVGNDALYGASGLAAARRALRPGGVLALWSAALDASFPRRLTQAGFAVSRHVGRSGPSGGARHLIWIARAPGSPPSDPGGRSV